MQSIEGILRKSNLKVTSTRIKILEVFSKYPHALSYNDLEKAIKEKLDKVTIYRTLKSFEEKGIIHQIFDASSQVKYAMCNDECSDHQHHDSHIHFKCNECRQTYCIDDKAIPKISLPSGFNQVNSSMLIEGTCKKCNHS